MVPKSDAPLPKGVERAFGAVLFLLAMVLAVAVVDTLLHSFSNNGWWAALAGGIVVSVLGFTGIVLMLQDRQSGTLRRLFYLFYGLLAVLLGCATAAWLGYLVLFNQAEPVPFRRIVKIIAGTLSVIVIGVGLLRQARKKRSKDEFLARSRIEMQEDKIWLSRDAKWKGISREIETQNAAEIAAIVLVAHFPDVLGELSNLVASSRTTIPIVISLAESLTTTKVLDGRRLEESAMVLFVVGEHHPALARDQNLIERAESLPCRSRVVFHSSLDDPLMKLFCPGIKETLMQQGMTEEEPINSSLISRQIRKAQMSLEDRTFGDSRAASAAEWIEDNMPQ